jgi:hypothetical protein
VTSAGIAAVREGCARGLVVSTLPEDGGLQLAALVLGGLSFMGLIFYGVISLFKSIFS